ncbi:BAR domain-containing protein, partial [Podospora australis]
FVGFKKNVNRATTQVMMKTGHVEKTNDRDYEVEERRFRTMEAASLRLQKEAKGYLDSLRGMGTNDPVNSDITPKWEY